MGLPQSLQSFAHDRATIVAASEVVAMDDPVEVALRKKKDSSMRVAIQQVKDGAAAAAVSAGNTGALMAIARYLLKTLDGIDRPAIATQLPNAQGGCHHGAGFGCECGLLRRTLAPVCRDGFCPGFCFARGGEPTVGLLNIGEEIIKGSEVIKKRANCCEQQQVPVI